MMVRQPRGQVGSQQQKSQHERPRFLLRFSHQVVI